MNPTEVNSVPPLNTAGATEVRGNIRPPTGISQPAANPARITDTRTPGPPRVSPRPARVPAAVNRPPVPRPVGPPRNPGPVRYAPRPGNRPPLVYYKAAKVSTLRRYCVPITTVVLVVASLAVIGILIKVVIDNYYFFCVKSFKFIPLDKWCDDNVDCSDGEDELECVQKVDFSNRNIVRLSDANSILQILTSSGTWSYICSDGFNDAIATSVCAEIGFSSKPSYSSVSSASLNGQFGNIVLNGPNFQVIPIPGSCSRGNVISLRCIDCGINNDKKERIIGGQETSIESSPWQVSLQYMGQHACGGSILNSRFILTAAHCFPKQQRQVPRWRVEMGHSILSFTFAAQVEKIFIPTSYTLDQKPNDIAILKMKRNIDTLATVQPICLPGFDSDLHPDASLTVTGWGYTSEGGVSSSTLQRVTVFYITNDVCNQQYFNQILNTMLCAGQLSGGKDTCQGDSGGPLVSLGSSSRWQQNGVVSWGDGCGRPGKPGVYSRVSSYVSWITSLMKVESQQL